jgi:hypothetical protein
MARSVVGHHRHTRQLGHASGNIAPQLDGSETVVQHHDRRRTFAPAGGDEIGVGQGDAQGQGLSGGPAVEAVVGHGVVDEFAVPVSVAADLGPAQHIEALLFLVAGEISFVER